MANVYDAVTREEAIRHAQLSCIDPRSAQIILDLIGWLDRHEAAIVQRTVSNQELEIWSLKSQLSGAREALREYEEAYELVCFDLASMTPNFEGKGLDALSTPEFTECKEWIKKEMLDTAKRRVAKKSAALLHVDKGEENGVSG
jgi:hypothetical protein